MFGSNYNTCILILATESMGQLKWRTDSKDTPKEKSDLEHSWHEQILAHCVGPDCPFPCPHMLY